MSGEQKEVRLREVFQDEHFSEADLARILLLSPSNAHYIRHKLLKQKKIARVSTGQYKFIASHVCSPSELGKSGLGELRCEPIVEYIRSSLLSMNSTNHSTVSSSTNLNFSITSCSLFNRFYPLYNYIIIYVEKGSSGSFLRYLPTLNLDYVILPDLEKKDIELLRDAAHKRNFILVRERSCLPKCSALKGIADMEHAFVDYYFEVTRNKLPLENKSKEILDYLLSHYTLNLSKLLRYAKERGIRKEVELLFENISFMKKTNVSKKNDGMNENDKLNEKEIINNNDDKHHTPKINPSQLNQISTSQGDHNES